MFRDEYHRPLIVPHFDTVDVGEHEIFVPKFKGIVKDRILDAEGNLIEERDWDSNLVVNTASVVIAALMMGLSGYAGCTWWAVGSGSSSWDTSPPNPSNTDSVLTNEVYRKQIPAGAISFIDSNGNVTATPTNTIQIQITFGTSEANYPLREFGIFGGNATSTANSGLMINHKIHPVITKTSAIQLQRTLKFTW